MVIGDSLDYSEDSSSVIEWREISGSQNQPEGDSHRLAGTASLHYFRILPFVFPVVRGIRSIALANRNIRKTPALPPGSGPEG
jgi:hypothetical protein